MKILDLLPDFSSETLRVDPLARAETIPSSWYTDPRFHTFEKESIFLRSWQYGCHESQIPNPGDHVTATVAENPLVIVRGKDGTVRAFYNVCRHRGGPLVTEERGNGGMLKCQYHGWTYQLDGCLRGVPRFDHTELFDKKDYGLLPIGVKIWQGIVFVNLTGEGTELETVVAGIPERIAPMRLDTLKFYRRVNYDVPCNWKVYVDNYLEGYHIPLVHPELCKVLDYSSYVTETYPYYSLQYSPFRDAGDDNVYGIGDGEAFYYFIYPNFMLNILPGRLQVNNVLPVAHDRCRVVFDYYYSDVTSPDAVQKIEDDLAFSDTVQDEDIGICEHVQRGLASRGYDVGRFSVDCEEAVYHFQCLLKDAFRRQMNGQV